MAASQGKSATAVADAVAVTARREVRPLEVHWRCTGGVDEGRLLLVLHSRMVWRLLWRLLRRYLLLLLELPEGSIMLKDSCIKDIQRSSNS